MSEEERWEMPSPKMALTSKLIWLRVNPCFRDAGERRELRRDFSGREVSASHLQGSEFGWALGH